MCLMCSGCFGSKVRSRVVRVLQSLKGGSFENWIPDMAGIRYNADPNKAIPGLQTMPSACNTMTTGKPLVRLAAEAPGHRLSLEDKPCFNHSKEQQQHSQGGKATSLGYVSIKSCAARSLWEDAAAVFRRDGSSSDSLSCGALLSAFAKCQRWANSMAMLREAREASGRRIEGTTV